MVGKNASTKLARYKSRRNLKKTPEPDARTRRKEKNNLFVIQKHDASHLHYDFRLGVEGVLASWAVPKGLSKKTNEKRLAVRTEDHPLEYADFEGEIPEGQYGAGAVEIWDKGTYEPAFEDGKAMKKGLEDGGLKFNLHGKKFKGTYAMARIGDKDGQEQWLIFKVTTKES